MAVGAAVSGLNGLALAKGFWLVGVNVFMTLGVWRHLRIKIFAAGIGWATLSGLVGLGLFWLARPYVGAWVAAGVGGLGYLALTTKTLYQELSDVMFQTRWEAIR